MERVCDVNLTERYHIAGKSYMEKQTTCVNIYAYHHFSCTNYALAKEILAVKMH
jgi:hypothetical protein